MIGGRRRQRTHAGRVTHGRIKPRVAARATAEERWHADQVRKLGCIVPGCGKPASNHHVTATIEGGRITRSHRRIVPLCPPHHQKVYDPKDSDPISVEGLGHKGFFEKYGIDLLLAADQLWEWTHNHVGGIIDMIEKKQ